MLRRIIPTAERTVTRGGDKKPLTKETRLENGTEVEFDPKTRSDDTSLTVRSLRLSDSQPGFPTASIDMEAFSKSRDLRIGIHGDVALVFVGIEAGGDGKKFARFSLQPLKLEPDIDWHSLRFGVRGYASELLATGTAVLLAKALRLDLPIPDEASKDANISGDGRVPVRDPQDQNWVHLKGSLSAGTVREEFSYAHPVFTEGGMWLGAKRRTGGQAPLEQVARGSKTDAQLDAEIADLRAKIRQVDGPSGSQGDVAVWIKGDLFAALGKKLSELSPDKRTATLVSDQYQGRIAEKEWRDNILGKGGVFVEFNKPDAVHATISVGEVGAKWVPQRGLAVSAAAHVKATADVHVHIDPLIGGGVGTNLGMEGSGDAQIAGEMRISKVSVGPRTVLALDPKMQCNPAKVELKTDGKLVTNWGWTKVPAIGARVETAALNNVVQPAVILSDAPIAVRGRTDKGEPFTIDGGGKTLLVTPAWKSAQVVLHLLDASAGDAGILASARLEVTSSPDEDRDAQAREESEAKLKRDVAEQLKAGDCSSDISIAVVIGDVEIGPNNEVVKMLRNAWNDITKGPGKNNEIVKAVKAATDALVAAGQPLDDATKGALNEINGLAGKTFGENSEAAKAINVATSIARPPSVGRNPGGGVTVSVPGATVSTGGGRGLGVTVETPLTGKLKF